MLLLFDFINLSHFVKERVAIGCPTHQLSFFSQTELRAGFKFRGFGEQRHLVKFGDI